MLLLTVEQERLVEARQGGRMLSQQIVVNGANARHAATPPFDSRLQAQQADELRLTAVVRVVVVKILLDARFVRPHARPRRGLQACVMNVGDERPVQFLRDWPRQRPGWGIARRARSHRLA